MIFLKKHKYRLRFTHYRLVSCKAMYSRELWKRDRMCCFSIELVCLIKEMYQNFKIEQLNNRTKIIVKGKTMFS